jgi:hypothetical protein
LVTIVHIQMACSGTALPFFLVHIQSIPTRLPWLQLLPTLNNLVAMVSMEHEQSKPTVKHGSPNNFEPQ